MMYISIAITLFALMAGMLLLAKTKKEGLGKFFSWISYIVIVISFLLLLCQLTHGIMRMTCCRSMQGNCMMDKESACPVGRCGPHGGNMMMHHGWMRGDAQCMEEMRECKIHGDSASCKMGMMHGCPMSGSKAEADSSKK
jgi:hypothetical protein